MPKSDLVKRLEEFMKPLDNEIMMCDNASELLLLASCMLSTAVQIYKIQIGNDGARDALQIAKDRIKDE
jgi:hypothetical protein